MHGGGRGSGAPKGNRNAYTHGGYSAKTWEVLRKLKFYALVAKQLLKKMDEERGL